MHVTDVSRSQIGYRWQDVRSTCILDETVLTRNSTCPETENGYVTYIALPGSGTMRGEWARSAPPRSKTLGYRSLEQSSITIQTPRIAADVLYRFYFLKYRPCWRGRSIRAAAPRPAQGSFNVAAARVSLRVTHYARKGEEEGARRHDPVSRRVQILYINNNVHTSLGQ